MAAIDWSETMSWEITFSEDDISLGGMTYGFSFLSDTGSADGEVMWGDGSVPEGEEIDGELTDGYFRLVYGTNTHTYSAPGTYIININCRRNSSARLLFGAVNGRAVTNIMNISYITEHVPNLIGHNSFANCSSLKYLPDLRLGGDISQLFLNCSSLQTIRMTLYEAVLHGAFQGCSSLKSVEINTSASSDIYTPQLTAQCFNGCTALEKVYINGKIHILDGSFEGCSALRDVYITNDATLGISAFRGCTALERISITGRAIMNNAACEGCASMTDFYAGSIKIEGYGVFRDCISLENIVSPKMYLTSPTGDFSQIFKNNYNLKDIPMGLFYTGFDADEIPGNINFFEAFKNAGKITRIPIAVPLQTSGNAGTLNMQNMYAGCVSIATSVQLGYFQNRTDFKQVFGDDCFYACVNIPNYAEISAQWGGGIIVSGSDTMDFSGRSNTLLEFKLDTTITDNGSPVLSEFETDKLPDGLALSVDGIISGVCTTNAIGAYYVKVKYDDYILKTITVNLRITNVDHIDVSVGTVGLKIGDKFIKIAEI